MTFTTGTEAYARHVGRYVAALSATRADAAVLATNDRALLDGDARAALRKECFRRLGSPSGPFALRARAWFVRGEV